jgi:hypothetical protein
MSTASETTEEQLLTCLNTTVSYVLVEGCEGKLHMLNIEMD